MDGKSANSSENRDDSYAALSMVDAETFAQQEEHIDFIGESDQFDPYDFGKQKNAISFWPAVIHTFIAAASPTLMNMPFAFADVGYAIGFAGSFLVVLFYANCMHTLLSVEYTLCRRLRKPNLSYAEVISQSFLNGPRKLRRFADASKVLVYLDFLCIWGGGNAINVLLASENVKCIYDQVFNADINIREVMLYLSFPLIALCWIPNLKLLAICSGVANIVNISCIGIIFYASFANLPSSSVLVDRSAFGSVSRVPFFLAVILITVNSTGIVMPLKNEMKRPASLASKFGVLNVAYVPVSFLYAFFGLVCYLRYGEAVQENIVLNMLADERYGKIVVGLYALGIIFTYPLMSYVSFDVVWNNILKDKVRKESAYATKKYCCRTLVAVSSIVLAFVVPNVGLFVSLTGNVGVSLDSIILPALADMLVADEIETSTSISRKRTRITRFCRNIVYIILGLIICAYGLFDSLATLINRDN